MLVRAKNNLEAGVAWSPVGGLKSMIGGGLDVFVSGNTSEDVVELGWNRAIAKLWQMRSYGIRVRRPSDGPLRRIECLVQSRLMAG